MSNRDLKRIALLLPNTDTILETDLQISLPSNIIIHTGAVIQITLAFAVFQLMRLLTL